MTQRDYCSFFASFRRRQFQLVFLGRTLHMCSDGRVLVTIRHGKVMCAVGGSTTEPSGQARHAALVASLPYTPCCVLAWLPQTTHELGTHQVLGSLCLWAFVTNTGLVPLTMVGFPLE